jgi:hypothetical protein
MSATAARLEDGTGTFGDEGVLPLRQSQNALRLIGHFQRAAITGEHAEPGEEIFARPTGDSPVGAHYRHMMEHPDQSIRPPGSGRFHSPEDRAKPEWVHPHLTAPDHGPYYVARDPDDPDVHEGTYHLLDREGRDATGRGGYKGGAFTSGWSAAHKDWHRLTHRAEPPDPLDGGDLIREHIQHVRDHPPQFPHSMTNPRDEEIATRPDARVARPEGASPAEEWHGPYEVVKHPDTGRFHIIDNAGRDKTPGWKGFEHQMPAERSRDYIDKRMQSKEKAKGIAEKLFSGVMDIMDPGGTPESRESERNTQAGQDLMTRYAGGRGRVKMDPEDEGGAPYYERDHYHENGKPSGWYAKHYGGTHFEIYHRGTGDEAHDAVFGLPHEPGEHGEETYQLHHGFGDQQLAGRLKEWHDEEHGMRHHLETESREYGGHPGIQRWKRRQGLAARQHGRQHETAALAAAPEMLDDDGDDQLSAEAALQYEHPADHPFFIAHPVSVDNLVAGWHDSHDEEKTEGKHWYPDGHHVSKALGNGDAGFGAGMLSAYSPRTHWPANLFHAARSIRDNRAVGPGEGLNVMEMHQNSGARILAGEHHSTVLTSPKTEDFAHLLEHGGQSPEDTEAGRSRVVVDRHALSAAVGRRLSDDENASAPIKRRKFYDHVAGMYTGAAKIISEQEGREVTPEHLQATLWLRQIRRNAAEDQVLSENSAKLRGQVKGRQTRYRRNWERWDTHVTEHGLADPPNLHLTPGLPHPHGMRKAAMKTAADEPTRTRRPYVDTLRQEQCPVCGESVWTGQRRPVCRFVAPLSLFRVRTPLAMEMRDQMESDPSQFPQGPADEAVGSFPDAENQLQHPDQLTPNGVPVPSGNAPDGLPQAGDEELQSPEELDEEGAEKEQEGEQEMAEAEAEEEGGALVCPECGTQFGPGDEGAEEGAPCPACGKGILQGADPGKDQDSPAGGMTMAGSAVTAAVRAQQGLIETQASKIASQGREIAVLQAQLRFVAELAGVGPELESIQKQADINNPGSPVPDPPAVPPTQSTEEALASGGYAPGGHSGAPPRGTGHTEDDPSRPGTTPGSTENVPAAATTTAITPGVEMQTPPATNLVDVTAPIQGTGGDSNPMPGIEQRRIETDVRVNPNPLAAQGPGIGGLGNDGTAFPWVISARESDGTRHTATAQNGAPAAPGRPGDASGARTMASMRLARLRVQAGLAAGDDLEVCAAIEADAGLSLRDIEHEIAVLSQVAQRTPPRRARPQRAATGARVPSMASPPQSAYSSPNGGPVDAEDIFLD